MLAKKKWIWNVAGDLCLAGLRRNTVMETDSDRSRQPQPMNVLNCRGLGAGFLNGNFGHLLFKFDDSLLLTADQVLERSDFFQDLLQLCFRFLWDTQDTWLYWQIRTHFQHSNAKATTIATFKPVFDLRFDLIVHNTSCVKDALSLALYIPCGRAW